MKYFTIQELSRSEKARQTGIDNTPSDSIVSNLTALVDNVLDPLREAWGKPIIVTSGYRCPRLNKAVGGATKSQHLTGHAADITTGDRVNNRKLFQMLIDRKLPFDQLIDEQNFTWVHVSYDPARNRRQILRL